VSSKKGVLFGILTIEDLRQRCAIDEITGCWVWKGGANGRKNNRAPSIWLPAIQKTTSAGAAICFLTTGRMPNPGEVWHYTCQTGSMCCNPKHRHAGDHSSRNLMTKFEITPATRARQVATRYGRAAKPVAASSVFAWGGQP
jgi:hypothetical protein